MGVGCRYVKGEDESSSPACRRIRMEHLGCGHRAQVSFNDLIPAATAALLSDQEEQCFNPSAPSLTLSQASPCPSLQGEPSDSSGRVVLLLRGLHLRNRNCDGGMTLRAEGQLGNYARMTGTIEEK